MKLKTFSRYIISFYNCVEVQLKSNKLHIFKVCSLIIFAVYSCEMYNVRDFLYLFTTHPSLWPHPWETWLAFCHYRLANLLYSFYKWNHMFCTLFPALFQHNYFETYSCCCLYWCLTPFYCKSSNLCYFKNWVIILSLSVLYSGYKYFVSYMCSNDFLQFVACLFISLIVFLKILILMKYRVSVYFFML